MKTFNTLKDIVDQLELPKYQTEDGLHSLSDNAAFVQLKNMSTGTTTNVIDGLKNMSNNYQVLNGQYVISKNVLDYFIAHLERFGALITF